MERRSLPFLVVPAALAAVLSGGGEALAADPIPTPVVVQKAAQEGDFLTPRYEPAGFPIIGGDSDIGFEFGAAATLSRFGDGIVPYRWNMDLVVAASLKGVPGGAEVAQQSYLWDIDIPGLAGGRLRLNPYADFRRTVNQDGTSGLGNASICAVRPRRRRQSLLRVRPRRDGRALAHTLRAFRPPLLPLLDDRPLREPDGVSREQARGGRERARSERESPRARRACARDRVAGGRARTTHATRRSSRAPGGSTSSGSGSPKPSPERGGSPSVRRSSPSPSTRTSPAPWSSPPRSPGTSSSAMFLSSSSLREGSSIPTT